MKRHIKIKKLITHIIEPHNLTINVDKGYPIYSIKEQDCNPDCTDSEEGEGEEGKKEFSTPAWPLSPSDVY